MYIRINDSSFKVKLNPILLSKCVIKLTFLQIFFKVACYPIPLHTFRHYCGANETLKLELVSIRILGC